MCSVAKANPSATATSGIEPPMAQATLVCFGNLQTHQAFSRDAAAKVVCQQLGPARLCRQVCGGASA